MANINTGIFRQWRNGGLFEIDDVEAVGAADTLFGVEENSLGFTPGMYEAYLARENGSMLPDFHRGDEQPTNLQLRVKLTDAMLASTGVLPTWLGQIHATDDGLVRKYHITTKFPTVPDGAAGKTMLFSDCIIDPGSVDVSGGQQYDILTARFLCPHGVPVFGTY